MAYEFQPQTYPLFNASRGYILDSESDSKEGIFVYKYDRKSRLIQRRVAGHQDFEVMVYDGLDRLVLKRDAGDDEILDNFGRSRWEFSKFDALDRPVVTGLIFLTQGYNRQTLQDDFDNHPQNQVNEVRGTVLRNYANNSFPSSYTPQEANLRSLNYYDNYTWQLDTDYNFKIANAFETQWAGSKKGLMTGKLVKNVRTGSYQKMVSYFDFKGREIQNFHFTNKEDLIRKDNQYRFNGELLKSRIEKKFGSTVLSNKEFIYEYDHVGRKTKFKHSTNGVLQNITTYKFDAIGRMQGKSFKASDVVNSKQTGNWTDVSTWLSNGLPTISDVVTINSGQTITIPTGEFASAAKLNDNGLVKNFGTLNMGKLGASSLYEIIYKYHIRGGLKGINTDANNNLTTSLFSYKLTYEDDSTYFNGNIRNQYWKSSIDGVQRAFQYSYDGASRLTGAIDRKSVV